jgi:hypothetical protein
VRSIRTTNRFTKFKFTLAELVNKSNINIDCIAVVETWIIDNEDFKMYELKNYNSFAVSKTTLNGGVILYVKSSINTHVIKILKLL